MKRGVHVIAAQTLSFILSMIAASTSGFSPPANPELSGITLASQSDSHESRTGFRGDNNQRGYIVYGQRPGHTEGSNDSGRPDPSSSNEEQNRTDGGDPEGAASDESQSDPLKIYIGDPTVAEKGQTPESLCQVSPNSQEVDPGCARIMRTACGTSATVFSYELGNGTSTARCVSEDEIEQAINDLQDQEKDSLPAAAYTAFTDINLEPAAVKFEPDLLGFGYEGRHTNMYADVDTQTVSQELLGQTVQIRAIPQEFHWDYGDGTSRTTFEPGGPLPDYDGTGQEIVKTDFKTVTSHVYEETGIYPVTVETVYTGQFRVGDGEWRDIPGTVSVESSPGEADIWTQNSRWVSGACESAEQWGCNGPIEFDPATDRPPKIYQDQYDENGRWLGPVE